jgi:hypothetical protein
VASRYSLKQLDADELELHGHRARYLIRASAGSVRIEASRGDGPTERLVWTVEGNTVRNEAFDREGRHLDWSSTVGAYEIHTIVTSGDKQYEIRSRPERHGVELAKSLAFGAIDLRYIGWLTKDLRGDATLRHDVRGRLPIWPVMNGGPVTVLCVAVCACCGFIVIDGPIAPPCCLACWQCMLE